MRAIPLAGTGARHPEKTQDARIIQISSAVVSTIAGAAASHHASVVRPGASSLPASAVWASIAVASAVQAQFSQEAAWAAECAYPADSQAAHWRADLIFRRPAHSLAGFPVD